MPRTRTEHQRGAVLILRALAFLIPIVTLCAGAPILYFSSQRIIGIADTFDPVLGPGNVYSEVNWPLMLIGSIIILVGLLLCYFLLVKAMKIEANSGNQQSAIHEDTASHN